MSTPLPTAAGVAAAAETLARVLPPTPLIPSEGLSRMLGADVWIKNEAASPITSFKLRGAYTELARASARQGARVVAAVTSSTGNHGQGVAYASRLLGVPAHIFLPDHPNPVKRRMIEALGAQIHEGGADIDEAKAHARDFCTREGMLFIDDGESLGVMEGAGTVGREVAASLEAVDWLFLPLGSGSLAAGSACGLKGVQPTARAVAVGAEASPAMVESFRARRPMARAIRSEAEGLACREPAHLALEAMLAFVNDVEQASDAEMLAGIRTLAGQGHVLAELSGAAAWAGAWRRRTALAGKRVVIVVSGANIGLETLQRALAQSA